MLLTEQSYKEGFYGFDITDCVVRNKDFFHFIVRDRKEGHKADVFSESDVLKKEIGVYLDVESDDERLSYQELVAFESLMVGATLDQKGSEVICIDKVGQVYSRGKGKETFENNIPESSFQNIVLRARMIMGRLYLVGAANSVCYRLNIDEWQPLSLNLPKPKEDDYDDDFIMDEFDLVDIDGFAFNDLYTIGRKGRVWHFNGQEWESIAFPSNMIMSSLCCADDGFVYISGQNGTVFRGRDNQWEMIHRGEFSLPFKDIVWHAGKVWCTSDYGLWVIENGKLEAAQVDSDIGICAGNLSVADGVMLLAGIYGAAYHDGKEWHLIFNGALCGDDGGWLGREDNEDGDD